MRGGFCVSNGHSVSLIPMQELLNARGAIIELAKIRDYCLSPDHPRGRHKARVFREALGLTVDDAEWLRHKIMDGIHNLPSYLQNCKFALIFLLFEAIFEASAA